ncbi:hypothetical protein [Ruminococcus flavefaciens]|uniref:hypothetical protein n=1 Tax=Ruminococcus flavefaciens TaxID=1265 RepID=UPI001A9A4341|nr:hypothetical protein [Ruminococcus flavefaciens]
MKFFEAEWHEKIFLQAEIACILAFAAFVQLQIKGFLVIKVILQSILSAYICFIFLFQLQPVFAKNNYRGAESFFAAY